MREKSAICRIIMTKLIAVSAITTLLGIEETLADLRSICASFSPFDRAECGWRRETQYAPQFLLEFQLE
jgi:hypothetical protein